LPKVDETLCYCPFNPTFTLDLHMASPVVLGWQQETGETYMNMSLLFTLNRVNKLVVFNATYDIFDFFH
jgi:hypothetical protein